ncbi:MAG: class I SAM-dependent methyltransferase [Promethearchaeota archaeon]
MRCFPLYLGKNIYQSKNKYQKVLNQLKMSQIHEGTWIDAGCGYGTYSLPLSTLVSRVIAIDEDPHKINYFRSSLPQQTNIECYVRNFNEDELFHELVDGILFGYSLHYQPDPTGALKNACRQIKKNGSIVIIDYDRMSPLPWVPHPLPRVKSLKILKEIGFKNLETTFKDGRIYIVRGIK